MYCIEELASFLGLPHFNFRLCSQYYAEEKKNAKNGEGPRAFITWVDRGGRRGRGRCSNMYLLNLKASFSPVKVSSFDHAHIWCPKLWYSARVDDPVHCFGSWAPPLLHPPRIHLTSFTWWMLPGLPRSSPAVYYCECKQGRPGNEAIEELCVLTL